LKTAIGATESVEWKYFENTTDAVSELKKNSYQVFAIEQAEGSTMLQDFEVDFNNKYALIFGNEVEGVANEVMGLVDGAIEVPQFGTKHSLNISVCVGVVVWEIFRSGFANIDLQK